MKSIHPLLFAVIIFFSACNVPVPTRFDLKFTELKTGSSASLRGLFVVDENTVWASGSSGTVLNSINGGTSWKVMQVPGAEKNDFRSIFAWDKNRAMVFGVAGPEFGYVTADGGDSWQVVFQDTTKGLFFDSLKFADENNGLAVSDPVNGKLVIIRTENAGKNWERISEIPDVADGEALFAASNTCIEFLPSGKACIATGGKAARVFYSGDFGKTWNVTETPMISGGTSTGIFSVSFQNETSGVVVGGIYDNPVFSENIAAFTSDGGITWQAAEKMPEEYRSCVQPVFAGKQKFWFAMGKTGGDISTDKGKTWQSVTKKGFYTFRMIPGKTSGFAAGSDGRISKMEILAQD